MKKALLILLAALIVIGAFYLAGKTKEPARVPAVKEIPSVKEYSSDQFKISFKYPAYYFLEEEDVDVSHRLHHRITLTEDTQENKAIREGSLVGGEGPISITIDIYQNNLDKQSAEYFIKNTSESNYKLGNGDLASTTKGTLFGIEYAWSGLYEGKSMVVSKNSFIYMFSVTRLGQSDRILADFEGILQTAAIE
jgi:hypothetical protein